MTESSTLLHVYSQTLLKRILIMFVCLIFSHGYKTGFYSSPHLVAARERIRINGKPISEEAFSEYFWNVFNPLQSKKVIK